LLLILFYVLRGGGEPALDDDGGKDPNAVALGRKGGLKGGVARAEKLTAQERSKIARLAAKSRWKKKSHNDS